jgi:GAF domain-containing protein
MNDMTGENCRSCEIAEEKVKYVEAFVNLTALVNSSLDISVIKKLSIEAAVKLTNSEAGSLLFVDNETGELFFDIVSGERGDRIRLVRLNKGQGIAGWVAENRLPLIVDDVQKDERFYREADEKSGFSTKNMICVPVEAKKNLIGVLQVINKRTGGFTTEDLVLMVTFSHQVAIAVENARLHEEMKETFFDIVQALAETIEMRDPYTGGHTRRVMEYSLAIGDLMGLSDAEMTETAPSFHPP